MSCFGRGRRLSDNKDTPLRRPGQLPPSKFKDIVEFINGLTIFDINSGSQSDEIVQIINDAIQNKTLKEVFDDLHERALRDSQFGVKLSLVCCDKKIYSINNNALRLILLQKLQSDYEERDAIKSKSIPTFRNAVTLLGEVFYNMRINNEPINCLATPLLDYLNMLLEISEEPDIFLVTVQIYLNGRKIFKIVQTDLENFSIKVRQVLINRNLSSKSRSLLLFIIDLANNNYEIEIIESKLKEFYLNENQIFDKIFNFDKIRAETDTAKEKNDDSMKNTKIIAPGSGISDTNDRPTPRAIRGAGALDSTKDQSIKKSSRGKKFSQDDVWCSSYKSNSPSWGHDDRFVKDYD